MRRGMRRLSLSCGSFRPVKALSIRWNAESACVAYNNKPRILNDLDPAKRKQRSLDDRSYGSS